MAVNTGEWATINAGILKDCKLFVDTPYSGFEEMLSGEYDSFIYDEILRTNLELTGKTVWDIGVEIGYHSLALAKLVGSTGVVVAIEPNPYSIARAKKQMEANPELGERIQFVEVAAGARDGEDTFLMSDNPDYGTIAHLQRDQRPGDRVREEIYQRLEPRQVQVKTLDSLVHDGLPIPSLVKIDVEGVEGEVLNGAKDFLISNRPVLALEVHNVQNMFRVQEVLLSLGYKTRVVGEPTASRAFLWAEYN